MRLPLLTLALVATPLAALALATPQAVAAPAPPALQDDKGPERPGEGDAAPLARVNDQDGKAVKLGGDRSDEEGSAWTVLAFFPKAATPG